MSTEAVLPSPDNEPDTIATPEGDNEGTPLQPPAPVSDGLERPRGDEPHSSQPIRNALS